MSNGYDQEDYYQLPEEQMTASTILQAIDKAAGIRGELSGQVQGMLRDYVEHARGQAVGAMMSLITAHPNSGTEIFEMQKEVAAYAHVMGWVQDQFDRARAADQQFQDVQRHFETPIEEQD